MADRHNQSGFFIQPREFGGEFFASSSDSAWTASKGVGMIARSLKAAEHTNYTRVIAEEVNSSCDKKRISKETTDKMLYNFLNISWQLQPITFTIKLSLQMCRVVEKACLSRKVEG